MDPDVPARITDPPSVGIVICEPVSPFISFPSIFQPGWNVKSGMQPVSRHPGTSKCIKCISTLLTWSESYVEKAQKGVYYKQRTDEGNHAMTANEKSLNQIS